MKQLRHRKLVYRRNYLQYKRRIEQTASMCHTEKKLNCSELDTKRVETQKILFARNTLLIIDRVIE